MDEIFKIALTILGSVGTAGAIIFGLSNWLGKVWASRLIESNKAKVTADLEHLSRKRDIYAKVAVNLRVFISSNEINKTDRKELFLEAYDEAYLWASTEVVQELGNFIDLLTKDVANPGSISNSDKKLSYAKCLHAMRQDSGHNDLEQVYRVASF